MNTSLIEFHRYCLAHNVTFVSYMMPGASTPITHFANSHSQITHKNIKEVDISSGFLFSPFQDEDLPTLVFPNENKHEGWNFELESYPDPLVFAEAQNSQLFSNIVDYTEYSGQIDYLKKQYLQDNSKKIVLSRIKSYNRIDFHLLPEVFEQLTKEYKHAFIYILYSPFSGLWLGATPETLLKIEDNHFSTMALAGTTQFEWSEKEIREQQHVINYVRKKLSEGAYEFIESERETLKAGNLLHLQSIFKGSLQGMENEWKVLVNLLYPSPAICGTDDDESLSIIRSLEKHKREYYSGIIGPFDNFGKTRLFINLRSMKVIGSNALLYAGGGILKTSDAQKEWDETELKFKTLLRVLEMVKNNNKKSEI